MAAVARDGERGGDPPPVGSRHGQRGVVHPVLVPDRDHRARAGAVLVGGAPPPQREQRPAVAPPRDARVVTLGHAGLVALLVRGVRDERAVPRRVVQVPVGVGDPHHPRVGGHVRVGRPLASQVDERLFAHHAPVQRIVERRLRQPDPRELALLAEELQAVQVHQVAVLGAEDARRRRALIPDGGIPLRDDHAQLPPALRHRRVIPRRGRGARRPGTRG